MTSKGPSRIPDRAQVVVVGGGIIGCSIAYHLTRRGVTDVVVLEQGTLTCGTTWHAAGLVTQLKSSYSLTKLATYSARLFEELEDETGQATGYRTPGSITVASDEQRWEEILRGASMAKTVGVETEVISIEEVSERFGLMYTDDLVGALYIPRDGQTIVFRPLVKMAFSCFSTGPRRSLLTACTTWASHPKSTVVSSPRASTPLEFRPVAVSASRRGLRKIGLHPVAQRPGRNRCRPLGEQVERQRISRCHLCGERDPRRIVVATLRSRS